MGVDRGGNGRYAEASAVNRRNDDPVPVPRQRRVEVGTRQQGGSLAASLTVNDRGTRVVVTVAHLTGMAVDVSPEDAEAFANGLLELVGKKPRRRP